MATLLINEIQWDCDGFDPVDDCALPLNVLVVGAPLDYEDEEYQERLACFLSDTYGFFFNGFSVSLIQGDKPGRVRHFDDKKIQIDAIMESP